jgi:hypothetical protein
MDDAFAGLSLGGQKRKLIVGIDFGTTYSGVAWAETRRVGNASCFRTKKKLKYLSQINRQSSMYGHTWKRKRGKLWTKCPLKFGTQTKEWNGDIKSQYSKRGIIGLNCRLLS